MNANALTMPELFLLIPLLTIACLLIVKESGLRTSAFVGALLSVLGCVYALRFAYQPQFAANITSYEWLDMLGSDLTLRLDGASALLCLLASFTTLCAVLITPKDIALPRHFFILIFFLLFGLLGVFLSWDLLSFYIFFEVVLIPSYFISIRWGKQDSLKSTNKFFLYTFFSSLFMLGAILMLYARGAQYALRWDRVAQAFFALNVQEKTLYFVYFLFAFAVKMPLFPFHTWQPSLYKNAPMPVVLLLSGVMVKMGLFGLLRWVLPFIKGELWHTLSFYPIILASAGVVYASLIAMRQNNLRGLAAYASIAHIGMMAVALLVKNPVSLQGAVLQMFHHGINIVALWILVDLIERQYGTSHYKELQGGLIRKHAALGAFFIIVSLANAALPVTNSFIGEFSMLYGITQYHFALGAVVGMSVIFSAVYMLIACSRVIYGSYAMDDKLTATSPRAHYALLSVISAVIFFTGIYAHPVLLLIKDGLTKI